MKSNRHLETKTLPIALSLLGFVLLFVGGPGPYSSRTFVSFWGLGHLFCFALWSSLYLYWRTPQKPLRQAAEVFLLALALGAATELLQVQFGRQASWQDLGSDILGAFLGLVFSASFKRQLSRYRKLVLQSIVVLIVVWGAGPFFKVAVDDLVAWHQFPVLADFETPLEISRWGGGFAAEDRKKNRLRWFCISSG